MPFFEMLKDSLVPIREVSFEEAGIKEREDLQRAFRQGIREIDDGLLVISEEYDRWQTSRRRADLVAIDKDANIVVVELKRTEDGGHMELQALRYAAMISTVTFDEAVSAYADYLAKHGHEPSEATQRILDHIGWEDPSDGTFGKRVRIILLSSGFSEELETTVMWLRAFGIDITCTQLKPLVAGDRTFLKVEKRIPSEAGEKFLDRQNRKERIEQAAGERTPQVKYDVTIAGETRRLVKGRSMLAIVQRLASMGVAFEVLSQVTEPGTKHRPTLKRYPGTLNSDQVQDRLATENSDYLKHRRYFTGEDELIRTEAETYILCTQWAKKTEAAMHTIIDRFPSAEISFRVAET